MLSWECPGEPQSAQGCWGKNTEPDSILPAGTSKCLTREFLRVVLSGPEHAQAYGWEGTGNSASANPGVTWSAPQPTGPLSSPNQCGTHRCPPGIPSNGPQRLCSRDHSLEVPNTKKSLFHTYSVSSLQKPWGTHSLHRRLSHTRTIIQDWESVPFQPIHRTKYRVIQNEETDEYTPNDRTRKRNRNKPKWNTLTNPPDK